MRNKFNQLVHVIKSNRDVFMLSEIKLDDTFLPMQYYIERYGPPFRLYQNNYVGDVMVYTREDFPWKFI